MLEDDGEMPAEFDLAAMGPPVQGKYAEAYRRHVRMVQLDDDLADLFPTGASVVAALARYAAEHPDSVG